MDLKNLFNLHVCVYVCMYRTRPMVQCYITMLVLVKKTTNYKYTLTKDAGIQQM